MIPEDKNLCKYTLQSLPYGSVIQYRKKRYYKSQGMAGDFLTAEKEYGRWHWIEGSCPDGWQGKNWKTFKVLFVP